MLSSVQLIRGIVEMTSVVVVAVEEVLAARRLS